jgi:hypothetical protein
MVSFFLYLSIALLSGIHHSYILARRQRRVRALEKLFQVNFQGQSVDNDLRLDKAKERSRFYEPIPLLVSEPITVIYFHGRLLKKEVGRDIRTSCVSQVPAVLMLL